MNSSTMPPRLGSSSPGLARVRALMMKRHQWLPPPPPVGGGPDWWIPVQAMAILVLERRQDYTMPRISSAGSAGAILALGGGIGRGAKPPSEINDVSDPHPGGAAPGAAAV